MTISYERHDLILLKWPYTPVLGVIFLFFPCHLKISESWLGKLSLQFLFGSLPAVIFKMSATLANDSPWIRATGNQMCYLSQSWFNLKHHIFPLGSSVLPIQGHQISPWRHFCGRIKTKKMCQYRAKWMLRERKALIWLAMTYLFSTCKAPCSKFNVGSKQRGRLREKYCVSPNPPWVCPAMESRHWIPHMCTCIMLH